MGFPVTFPEKPQDGNTHVFKFNPDKTVWTLTQKTGTCLPISHLASGHHFTPTHFDGRLTAMVSVPQASYFKGQVSITM